MRHWHGYVGARLHRQLFAAFALAIVFSGATVGLVFHLFSDDEPRWHQEHERIRKLTSTLYADIWNSAQKRTELSTNIAKQLRAGVRVINNRGATLEHIRVSKRCRWVEHIDVTDRNEKVGRVDICFPPRKHARPWIRFVAFGSALVVLWLLAGMAARRIAWPLRELTRVTREIGAGNLKARARLRHGRRGEVGELTHAVNDMVTRIESQLRAQQELLASASHELRTPLARMRVLAEMAREQGAPDSLIQKLEAEMIEMDTLVGDLLAGARLDFEALSLRKLNIHDIVTRVVERAAMPNLKIELTQASGDMLADATLLSRALGALLDNARKHGGAHIVLRARTDEQRVIFSVEDDGAGFVPGEETRVFEPFYRGHGRAHDEARGVGLGLALVRRIAEAHRGRAYAQNAAPSGAQVVIDLPREPGLPPAT